MSHKAILPWLLVGFLLGCRPAAENPPDTIGGIPREVFLDILQAEDTRQWNAPLENLLIDPKADSKIRSRVALAAGRIGDAAAVPVLSKLLSSSAQLGPTAAFALGEIESVSAATALIEALRTSEHGAVRAASVEALGKIAAALPEKEVNERKRVGDAILETLKEPEELESDLIHLAITAALRAKPVGAPPVIARFLGSNSPERRAHTLNALARLGAKEALDRVRVLLTNDTDPLVRANVARVLGAAVDKTSVDDLATIMSMDSDSRARVAAIRALASIAQTESAKPLLARGETLRSQQPTPKNELLEIATALGRVLLNTNDETAIAFLLSLRQAKVAGPEVEIAFARIAPEQYLNDPFVKGQTSDWRPISAIAQGLGAIATLDKAGPALRTNALAMVRTWIETPSTPNEAMYDVLQAFNAFKPKDRVSVVIPKLKAKDVVIRAAAADILSEVPPSPEITRALTDALRRTANDTQNDAALSIVGALAKVKSGESTAALQEAAGREDYLVRQRAVNALKDRAGVTPPGVGPVKSRNTRADYLRAAQRIRDDRAWTATLTTTKGEITIRLDTENAPLTVDNFIQLANAHFFDGLTFHRVVPNFVIQGGDPRGDGNGGPGYTIRCEINPRRYATGAVGMALSGKDTGGSQFFVTHSPQPHLDGGYTVFGRVVAGQDVVDRIERGDGIRAVTIKEEIVREIY